MLSQAIAYLAVRRPLWLLAIPSLALLWSLNGLFSNARFDSDILNLLPDNIPAVEGLRTYERGFTQARELAFVLDWSGSPELAELVREDFSAALANQPWVVRILSSPPLQNTEILPPLLLNLSSEKFQELLASLEITPLTHRLRRLASSAAAGSPVAIFELSNDPAGLFSQALQPLVSAISLDHAFDLTSPNGRITVVPCVTNQHDLSPEGCNALMKNVQKFINDYKRNLPTPTSSQELDISVTGRSAYVVDVSASMQRDIKLTSTVSLVAVVALFWLGFRKILPLLGIALLLATSAIISTTLGMQIFGSLNVIAVGFCSILFGLGDDFSLLICQAYATARAKGLERQQAIACTLRITAPGILSVSLTTAMGFLALLLAGSAGFRQLGLMVALGVMVAAGLMLCLLPIFLRSPMLHSTNAFGLLITPLRHKPSTLLLTGVAVTILAGLVAISPWRPLHVDLSPSSLEPTGTDASKALRKIMSNLPGSYEPVIAILQEPSPERLNRLTNLLIELKNQGKIISFSSPQPLLLDAHRMADNLSQLQKTGLSNILQTFSHAAETAGLSEVSRHHFQKQLQQVAQITPSANWASHLPTESPWWFLLDRMTSPDGKIFAAQIQTPPSISDAERRQLAATLESIEGVQITGWSQTLATRLPWARNEMLIFGCSVLVIIAALLLAIYRNALLWSLHILSLASSATLALAILKIAAIPVNLLNALAIPLILGVGVDYGTHIILASKEKSDPTPALLNVLKPVLLSGLTTLTGFGALTLALNPALSNLGWTCAVGVAACLVSAFTIVAPGSALLATKNQPSLTKSS